MASWQDGPEYAPQERPAAFVVPPAAPLSDPTPAPVTVPEPPIGEPSFTPPSATQPDLAALVPSAAPGRNPTLPFEVVTATVTNAGGWATTPAPGQAEAGQRPPTQPFNAPGPSLNGYLPVQPTVAPNAQVNPAPFPAPGTPQWFAPPPGSRVPDAPPPVTIGQIWTAATAGVMVPLIIGALFNWFSILMLALSFALSARIVYRHDAVRRSYIGALIVVGVLGMMSMLSVGYSSDLLFQSLSDGSQFACVVLFFVIGLIVGAALRAGERPDRMG
ncbi:MAG TPA: hypothetical protein VGK18_03090 [Propionicimonas sp.]|jgi:hypothetical protein|uniref:hypothetical protein n=1 Tax=Propionicimonas sp. TaxID=1955623 RepID=UPI002F40AFA3